MFNNVIEVSEKAADLQKRLQILIDEITVAVYTNISRGLFERHKLVFSFMLCISIMKHQGLIPEDYWNFLLRGPPSGVKVVSFSWALLEMLRGIEHSICLCPYFFWCHQKIQVYKFF